MPVPYFYEPNLLSGNNNFTLSEASSKHCIQVLRMQENARIDLTNGKGFLFEAKIQVPHKKNSIVTILSEKQMPAPTQSLTLGIALLKNATRLEWLIEKATEMGVTKIVPMLCERTLFEKFKLDRMQNILQSAMIQSQQSWLPNITAPIKFKEVIAAQKNAQKLIAHCEAGDKIDIKKIKADQDCLLLIGPEGDFSPKEIELALQNGYQAIHLGPTRLRTETAGLFALSVLKNF
ncbi:MAG: RsmE family RNA methyltransferase [Bacteroidetes bacterium]|nr:RsmE family RNA methyltransferase [Bacteroidota bacterium]